MGHVLILYDSASGNTEQMAEYVTEGAREIEGIEVRCLLVSDASLDDLRWADGIALGSPTYVGLTSWRMKRFWDEAAHKVWGEMDGKIGCAFSSSGGWGGGSELACMSALTMMMNLGMLTFGVTDYVGRRFTLHHGAVTAGEPRDEAAIEACRRLGKRLAQWVAVFFDGRSDAHPGPIKDRS